MYKYVLHIRIERRSLNHAILYEKRLLIFPELQDGYKGIPLKLKNTLEQTYDYYTSIYTKYQRESQVLVGPTHHPL